MMRQSESERGRKLSSTVTVSSFLPYTLAMDLEFAANEFDSLLGLSIDGSPASSDIVAERKAIKSTAQVRPVSSPISSFSVVHSVLDLSPAVPV